MAVHTSWRASAGCSQRCSKVRKSTWPSWVSRKSSQQLLLGPIDAASEVPTRTLPVDLQALLPPDGPLNPQLPSLAWQER